MEAAAHQEGPRGLGVGQDPSLGTRGGPRRAGVDGRAVEVSHLGPVMPGSCRRSPALQAALLLGGQEGNATCSPCSAVA